MTPRNEDQARVKLLADCQRPAFAKLARYTKAMEDGTGDVVTRASVKFVEAALARWGNVRIANVLVTDTDKTRTVRVIVSDLEGGAEYSKEIPIDKVVERQKAARHDSVIRVRNAPGGIQVYQVAATEDDLASREAQLTSVVVRQLGLRILPADLVAECMEAVAQTLGEPDQAAPVTAAAPAPPQTPPAGQESRSSALAGLLATRKARRPRKSHAPGVTA